jgi:hypothetical protein
MSGVPDLLLVDGHGLSWKRLVLLRKQQVEAFRLAQARQLALFELHDDHRPEAMRSASSRFAEPSLLDWGR